MTAREAARQLRGQRAAMAERGDSPEGYVAFYAQQGQDADFARTAYNADRAALRRLEQQAGEATGLVTVATMIVAGGDLDTIYGVYRVRLKLGRRRIGEDDRRYWDLNAPTTSERLATVRVPREPRAAGSLVERMRVQPPAVIEAIREHATEDAPGFAFGLGLLV